MPSPYNYSNNLPNGTFNGFWVHKRDVDGDVIVDSFTDSPNEVDGNALINGLTIADYNAQTTTGCDRVNITPCKTIAGTS